MRSINPSQLVKELKSNAAARVPSMVWGGPGLGKSQIVYQLANELGAKLFELRANLFDPVDVRGGLKVVEQQDGSYKTRYGIPEDYPDTHCNDTVVLLIDELPNAPKATQNALLQLILDRKIGTYELPKNTIIIAAGNRAQDRAAVHEMPTPVKNRFAHYELAADIDDWCAWALNNGIDSSIVSFLRYRPTLLHAVDSLENAFPTPRAWEMLNRKLPHMSDEFYGCASVIGDGPTGEYLAFKRVYADLPDIDNIYKSPTTARVPSSPSSLYAVAGAIASTVDKDTFDAAVKYINRMPAEYQVLVMRDSVSKDRELVQTAAFQKWSTDNATTLL